MTVQEIDKIRYNVLGPKVVKALENKYYEAYYCSSVKEGVKKALSLIPQNSIVSWGGSQSCLDSGLIDCVKNGNYKIIDRDSAKTPEERYNLMRDALFSDVYLTSFNAISEDGIIYNIDGNLKIVYSLLQREEYFQKYRNLFEEALERYEKHYGLK